MPGPRFSTSLSGRQGDWICLAILLLAAPVLWLSDQRFGDLSPDGVAYLTLAKSLLRDGRIYLESWGHIDEGLIVPPLYPALIAGATPFFSDSVEAALALSWACSVLTLVVLFLLIRGVAGRWVALAACLAIAWDTVFIKEAFSVLTEALFIFVTSCALLALAGVVTRRSVGLAFLCGVLGGLAFLARKIGLVVPVFCVLWVLLAELRSRPLLSPLRLSRPLFILLGSALVIAPYAGVLWAETGQNLLQRVGRASLNPLGGAGVQPMPGWQRFRMDRYVVETNDARVLEEIERIRSAGEGSLNGMYRSRIRLRRLLPDGSEMYSHVRLGASNPPISLSTQLKARATEIPTRFWNNLGFLRVAMGWPLFVAFGVSLVTVFYRRPGISRHRRGLLAAFALFYMACLSLASGLLQRYVDVITPFAVAYVAAELRILARVLAGPARRTLAVGGTAAALVVAGALNVWQAPFPWHFMQPLDQRSELTVLRDQMEAGAEIFATHPRHAYALGGHFRALPNDDLESVVEYGLRTGVRWLVVSDAKRSARHYDHADWIKDPKSRARSAHLLELCCSIGGNRSELYRIVEPVSSD